MPLIRVKLLGYVFIPKRKQDVITRLTEAMVATDGENMRSVTRVILDEVRSGDWAIGGQALTTNTVREVASGMQ